MYIKSSYSFIHLIWAIFKISVLLVTDITCLKWFAIFVSEWQCVCTGAFMPSGPEQRDWPVNHALVQRGGVWWGSASQYKSSLPAEPQADWWRDGGGGVSKMAALYFGFDLRDLTGWVHIIILYWSLFWSPPVQIARWCTPWVNFAPLESFLSHQSKNCDHCTPRRYPRESTQTHTHRRDRFYCLDH